MTSVSLDRSATRTPTPAMAAVPVRPLLVLLTALAVLLTATSGRYGYHRDELYFLVAAEHPAWGYVDQPPLTPMLARLAVGVFGDGLVGLRVPATLLCLAAVLVVALIARELGGDRRAQLVAAGCAAGSAFVLAVGHMLATATVDVFFWLLICGAALRLLRTADPRWYLPLGVVTGLGALNKHLVVLLVAALLLGVLAVGPRSVLRTWWLPVGALVALAIAAPNLWWQAANGWPQLEVAAGLVESDGGENRALFVPLQVVYLSPLFVPIWVAGILRLVRDPAVRWARSVVAAYAVLLVAVLALGGKAYYVLPLLLVLTAAGATPAARALSDRVLAAGLVVAAAVNIVGSLPVLPPSALGPAQAVNGEQGEQLGWPDLVDTVAGVWARIPLAERAGAVVFTTNYGEAAAVARFGPGYGLPAAYSAHMSYADWGPPPDAMSGPVVVVAHEFNRAAQRFFTRCRPMAEIDNGYGVDNDEQGVWVRLCDGTTAPWSMLWPQLRHYR